MAGFVAWWKGTGVAIKVATVCVAVVVVAGASVGMCVLTGEKDEVLVSGALVTVTDMPDAPEGVVVIAQETEFGGPKSKTKNALQGSVYFLPENTFNLVDVSGMKPVASLYASKLDIAPRSWQAGFPGVPGGRFEWFEIVYKGKFATARSGGHLFELHSDDGARLFVNGQQVVDNDGRHPPETAKGIAMLEPGKFDIRVEYFQGPRFEIALQLYVTPPGGTRQILDVSQVL